MQLQADGGREGDGSAILKLLYLYLFPLPRSLIVLITVTIIINAEIQRPNGDTVFRWKINEGNDTLSSELYLGNPEQRMKL